MVMGQRGKKWIVPSDTMLKEKVGTQRAEQLDMLFKHNQHITITIYNTKPMKGRNIYNT